MTSFSIVALLFGTAAVLGGAMALVFRRHVLEYVHKRYVKIYQEDSLSVDQVTARLPKMAAVITIASGFEVIGALFMTVGIVALVR